VITGFRLLKLGDDSLASVRNISRVSMKASEARKRTPLHVLHFQIPELPSQPFRMALSPLVGFMQILCHMGFKRERSSLNALLQSSSVERISLNRLTRLYFVPKTRTALREYAHFSRPHPTESAR